MDGYRDILKKLANRRWTIKLATHLDTNIDNETSAPTLQASTLRMKDEEVFVALGRCQRPPTSGYNCFGQTFALRRTAIYETKYIELILLEDGFGEIKNDDDAQVGDVVLYSDEHGYDHAARIIRHEPLLAFSEKTVAVVLSKFDDVSGEYEHRIDDLRWASGRGMLRKIYRDRHDLPRRHPTWRQSLAAIEPESSGPPRSE
jgi:hypothetical protein